MDEPGEISVTHYGTPYRTCPDFPGVCAEYPGRCRGDTQQPGGAFRQIAEGDTFVPPPQARSGGWEPAYTLALARDTLRDIADRLQRLSTRQQRKLFRQTGLDAGVIRNEAERCQDILTLHGH